MAITGLVIAPGRPLHRGHGGLGQTFPIGLEEGPPVFAGGNDVLQDLNGLGTVAYPSVKAGGVVIVKKIINCKDCGRKAKQRWDNIPHSYWCTSCKVITYDLEAMLNDN